MKNVRIAGNKLVKSSLLTLLMVATMFGGYIGYLQLSGNFHTVIAQELYRSAQPSSAQLEDYVRDHGIKTVINLRGENETSKWYDEEVSTARRLGVRHLDFRLSASKIVSPAKIDALVTLMKTAQKPILIHCLSGADRTGLVSAIYSQQVAGLDEDIAERQLSPYYGHVAIPYLSSSYAMDISWQALEKRDGLEVKNTLRPSGHHNGVSGNARDIVIAAR
jgi:protein tyrosine/serine phosphatase